MSIDSDEAYQSSTSWSALVNHDWRGPDDLILSIERAIRRLDGVDEQAVIYDYIDVEAVTAVFGPDCGTRGAHSLRFHCESYEVKIESDGTIAARPRPGREIIN